MNKSEHQFSAKIYQFQPRRHRDDMDQRLAGKPLQAREDDRHFVDFTACYHDAAIEKERAGKA